MNNGFFGKAMSGLGTGLAIAGQMSLHAKLQGDLEAQRGEIMAKRDEVLQGFENQRNAATITGQKEIHAADRASSERVGLMQKEAHLEGIDKQLNAKENKIDFKDGVAFLNGAPSEELTKQASALTKKYGTAKTTELLQNMQGLIDTGVAKNATEAFNQLKPPNDVADKMDARVSRAGKILKDVMEVRGEFGEGAAFNPDENPVYLDGLNSIRAHLASGKSEQEAARLAYKDVEKSRAGKQRTEEESAVKKPKAEAGVSFPTPWLKKK